MNIPLTTPDVDFTGGGTFFPTPCGNSKSKGLILKPMAGHAIIHNGNRRHAGDRIDTGERMVLVAFFYGKERRGKALPLAKISPEPPKEGGTRLPPPMPDMAGARLLTLKDVLALEGK